MSLTKLRSATGEEVLRSQGELDMADKILKLPEQLLRSTPVRQV